MAGHAEFTGAGASTAATYDGAAITGWQEITIAEKFKPLPEPLDKTHAGDATYQWMDNPLGGKGAPSCTVTLAGLISVTDHQDTGLLSRTIDAALDLIVTTKALGDKFTLEDAAYKGMSLGDAFANVQPYTATFNRAGSAGAWSTAS